MESPSIDGDYEEGKDDKLLQRNKTEDENLVGTDKVKIEAACYFIHVHVASYFTLPKLYSFMHQVTSYFIKFMLKHSKKLILRINRREIKKVINNYRIKVIDLSVTRNELEEIGKSEDFMMWKLFGKILQ